MLAASDALAATGVSTQLCDTPNGVDIVGITEFVALVGAAVGGIAARQRKEELQQLNDQLRRINAQLRREARTQQYAPGLRYAPTTPAPTPVDTLPEEKQQLISLMKDGKNLLKEEKGRKALSLFKEAWSLLEGMETQGGDKGLQMDLSVKRRCARGIAAALQQTSQYEEAVEWYFTVLRLSKQMKEFTGDTDALGAIADCYTDLGDMEKAGRYYDMYIGRMENDEEYNLTSFDEQVVKNW